jgi:sec-independent protein translocase protein TatA
MGPLGTPELVAIFVLALLLFGPKELPKIGKTIGKAITEFRRAQAELKTTFDREMKNLERETGIKELAATTFQSDYSYEQSSYDPSHYEDPYDGSPAWNPSATNVITYDASAPQGVESASPLQIEAAHGTVANGHMEPEYVSMSEARHGFVPAPIETPEIAAPAENGHPAHSAAETGAEPKTA